MDLVRTYVCSETTDEKPTKRWGSRDSFSFRGMRMLGVCVYVSVRSEVFFHKGVVKKFYIVTSI